MLPPDGIRSGSSSFRAGSRPGWSPIRRAATRPSGLLMAVASCSRWSALAASPICTWIRPDGTNDEIVLRSAENVGYAANAIGPSTDVFSYDIARRAQYDFWILPLSPAQSHSGSLNRRRMSGRASSLRTCGGLRTRRTSPAPRRCTFGVFPAPTASGKCRRTGACNPTGAGTGRNCSILRLTAS